MQITKLIIHRHFYTAVVEPNNGSVLTFTEWQYSRPEPADLAHTIALSNQLEARITPVFDNRAKSSGASPYTAVDWHSRIATVNI